MDSNVDIELLEIISKVKKLKTRLARLEAENESLKQSVFTYLEQLDLQKKENVRLTQDIQHVKMAKSINGSGKDLSKEIDKYLLLLDKCIAAVNTKM